MTAREEDHDPDLCGVCHTCEKIRPCPEHDRPPVTPKAEPPTAREVIEADRRRQLYERHPTLKPAEPDAVPGWCVEAARGIYAAMDRPMIVAMSRLIHEAWKRSEGQALVRTVAAVHADTLRYTRKADARAEAAEARVDPLRDALREIAVVRCGIPGHSVAVGCKAASIARAALAETQGGEEGR